MEQDSMPPMNSGSQKSAQSYACVICAQRKVKCDRQAPCSNCIKGRVQCEYRAPPPAKRRKRKQTDESDSLAKLNRYEKILNTLGIDVDDPSSQTSEVSLPRSNDVRPSQSSLLPSRSNEDPQAPNDRAVDRNTQHIREYRASTGPDSNERVFVQGNKLRYVENNLWGSLSDEVLRPKDMLPAVWDLRAKSKNPSGSTSASDRGPTSVLFSSSSAQADLRELHPSIAHAQNLWKIFRSNVDPLTKLFDINTKEQMFLKSISKQRDGTSPHSSALFFAVYLCAITSIEDEECLSQFGETRSVLLDRYQWATEQALIDSRLLHTSDMFVLQAFFMYLLCMRHRTDAGSLWILNGICVRMAQRGGLHRDADFLGDTTWPWSAELRRRLWWQIAMLDGRSAELSGFGKSVWPPFRWDTKIPLNINDDDLRSDSTTLPPSRTGATDMIFCSIGYEFCSFFRDLDAPLGHGSQGDPSLIERSIDELERRVEQQYLSYCDPLVPLHFLSVITARSAFASMRFRANHPRRLPEKGADASQAQKDKLFGLALKVLEYDNMAHSSKSIRKFKFHIEMFFPWHQLIYVLSELRTRTTGNDADRAWEQIEEMFEHRREKFGENTTALHSAVANLAIKVWDARRKDFERQLPGIPLPKTPQFIEMLQALKAPTEFKASAPQTAFTRATPYDPVRTEDTWKQEAENGYAEPTPGSSQSLEYPSSMPMDYYIPMNTDPSPSNWPEWDDLIFQDFNFAPGFVDPGNLFGPAA